MSKVLALAFAALLGLSIPASTLAADAAPTVPLTIPAAAQWLQQSVVAVTYRGDNICSAAKIGPGQFLTAFHCLNGGIKIETQKGRILKIKSVLAAFEEKKPKAGRGDRDEDWAIINTVEDDESVMTLDLGCDEKLYLGQGIAYAGYPYPTQYAFGVGHITGLLPLVRGGNHDFQTDVHAAPGASGSAVISLDTGRIIGVLTEGVPSQAGFFMVGMESVTSLDACDGMEMAVIPSAAGPTADALEK
jgi:V8-like Glu-specific endopeptidase